MIFCFTFFISGYAALKSMTLEDMSEVDFGSATKGAFVIVHEQASNKYYLRAVQRQGSHIFVYSLFFCGEVIVHHLPTALFCPRGGGFFESDSDKKIISFSGRSESFGCFDESILIKLIQIYLLRIKKEYVIVIKKEQDASLKEDCARNMTPELKKGLL